MRDAMKLHSAAVLFGLVFAALLFAQGCSRSGEIPTASVEPSEVEAWCQNATRVAVAKGLVEVAAASLGGDAGRIARSATCATTAAVIAGGYSCLDYYDRLRGGAGVAIPTTLLDAAGCRPDPGEQLFDQQLPDGLVLTVDAVFDLPQGGMLLGKLDADQPPIYDLACNALEQGRAGAFSVMLEFTLLSDSVFGIPGTSAQPGECAAGLRAREAARLRQFAEIEAATPRL